MSNSIIYVCPEWPLIYDLGNSNAVRICVIVTSVLNGIFALPAIVLNGIVILAILRTRNLRIPSNFLLCNLAMTDLFIGLLMQPLYIVSRLLEINSVMHDHCAVGIVASYISNALPLSLILTLTVMSLDRYLAIRLMLQYRSTVTSSRVILAIIALWMFVILCGFSPVAFGREVFLTFLAVVFLFCLLVTFVTYFKAFRSLRKHQVQVNTDSHDAAHTVCINVKKYHRSFTTMLCVFLLQLVCYSPDICSKLASVEFGISPSTSVSIIIAETFVFINATLNPLFYFWRLRDVRRACVRMIRKVWKQKDDE